VIPRVKQLLPLVLLLILPLQALSKETTRRFKVKEVAFEGNQAFASSDLQRIMITRPSSLLTRVFFRSQVLDEDLKNLTAFYQEHGYLEATVTASEVRLDSVRHTARIKITISEGGLTTLESIAFFGNHNQPDSLLLQTIGIKAGDPFESLEITAAVRKILTLYANQGFLDTQIQPDTKINEETHKALVDFIITEGIQYTVDDIRYEGLEKTRHFVVDRELLLHPGDIVKYGSLIETRQRLFRTGLFQNVQIYPVTPAGGDSTKKNILLEFQEFKSIRLGVSVGYATVEQARARVELYNANLFGTARKIGLTGQISFIQRSLEASYSQPWIFGYRWNNDLTFKYEFQEEPSYELYRKIGRGVLWRALSPAYTISFQYRYETTKFANVSIAETPVDLKADISSLIVQQKYDVRDDMINSRRGSYLQWDNELAGSVLGATTDFFRTVAQARSFRSLSRATVVGTALEIGWMGDWWTTRPIPLSERFYAGGPNVLRGFGYQQVGPKDVTGEPIGGNFKITWNVLELRQSVWKMFGVAAFFDAGSVWSSFRDFHLGDVRTSPGAGIRANTPLGIIRLDVGFNPWKKNDEDNVRLYFSVGQAF
jgi:outer membrane protein insertion porin family/translocation and assembly module TamA